MRKMDEMEMNINLKAIRIAYGFTSIFLFIWLLYDWIQNGILGWPAILFFSQNAIFFVVTSFLKRKMNKNEK